MLHLQHMDNKIVHRTLFFVYNCFFNLASGNIHVVGRDWYPIAASIPLFRYIDEHWIYSFKLFSHFYDEYGFIWFVIHWRIIHNIGIQCTCVFWPHQTSNKRTERYVTDKKSEQIWRANQIQEHFNDAHWNEGVSV